jgi:hypothetical protein
MPYRLSNAPRRDIAATTAHIPIGHDPSMTLILPNAL